MVSSTTAVPAAAALIAGVPAAMARQPPGGRAATYSPAANRTRRATRRWRPPQRFDARCRSFCFGGHGGSYGVGSRCLPRGHGSPRSCRPAEGQPSGLRRWVKRALTPCAPARSVFDRLLQKRKRRPQGRRLLDIASVSARSGRKRLPRRRPPEHPPASPRSRPTRSALACASARALRPRPCARPE